MATRRRKLIAILQRTRQPFNVKRHSPAGRSHGRRLDDDDLWPGAGGKIPPGSRNWDPRVQGARVGVVRGKEISSS